MAIRRQTWARRPTRKRLVIKQLRSQNGGRDIATAKTVQQREDVSAAHFVHESSRVGHPPTAAPTFIQYVPQIWWSSTITPVHAYCLALRVCGLQSTSAFCGFEASD